MESEPSLDLAVIASLKALNEPGDGRFFKVLTSAFLLDASDRLSEIRHAVDSGDYKAVERASHSLKGSSGNMGARKLHGLMNTLCEMAIGTNLVGAYSIIERSDGEFRILEVLLRSELDSTM